MNKFPFYQQLDMMDCGPSCLRIIAKYYGRSYSLESLRQKSQIGKEGVSLLGVAEAAELIGLRSTGVKLTFDQLAFKTQLPCIVHWDQNHFVVVYDVKTTNPGFLGKIKGGFQAARSGNPNDGDAAFLRPEPMNHSIDWDPSNSPSTKSSTKVNSVVFVSDPGQGLLTYRADEFCRHWINDRQTAEGITLLLEPTPLFYEKENEKDNKYSFSRVLHYFWQYKSLIFQLGLGIAVASVLQLIFPFLTQSIVDVGINTENIAFVYLVLLAQLMLMIGRLTVDFIRSWILLHISARINLNLLSDFLIKLMRLPIAFFDTKQLGDLMQRLNDHQRIESFLTGPTLTVIFSLFNLVVFSIVLALFDVMTFSIFCLSSILYMGWVFIFLQKRRKLDYLRFEVGAKNQSALIQLMQGMQEIKLAGAEKPMRWGWEDLQVKSFRLQMKGLTLTQVQQAGAFVINEGKNIFITFFVAQSVINGQLTLGAMLAIQQIIGQLNSPIEQLIGFVQNLQDAKISLERLNEIHTIQDEEVTYQPLPQLVVANQDIRMIDVSYKYVGAGNEFVLQKINLSIPAGKTTAIVGMSGSGKTTLLKLLLKFYEPIEGSLLYGDLELRQLSHRLWRSKCGVVTQEGYIFSDTIAYNITIGFGEIDLVRLQDAIRIANLSEFVESLPLGYNTKIGAEGKGISQGQRQRILIARAVYKNPSFIFFDEATNALDATNEAIIVNNLNQFFQGKTVVIVAHRLSTVCNADQIVVLSKGRIAEVGSHPQLVAQRGEYWRLIKNQLELGV